MAHPPKPATPAKGIALLLGWSIVIRVGFTTQLAIWNELLAVACFPVLDQAVTSMLWVPFDRNVVSSGKFHPTFGQPARPGKWAHTSGRFDP